MDYGSLDYDGLGPDALCEGRNLGVKDSRAEWVRYVAWNFGTMTVRAGGVVMALGRRRIDVLCVQETRKKGERTEKFGRRGCEDGNAGVGVFVVEEWIEKEVNVNRLNDWLMVLKMRVGKQLVHILLLCICIFPYLTIYSYWALPLIHFLLSTNM